MTPMSSPLDGNGVVANTDRELWREREGDFYADSLHVTANGGIGINCGGTVIVKPLRDWFALASAAPSQTAVEPVAYRSRWLPSLQWRVTKRPPHPSNLPKMEVQPLVPLSTLTAQAAALVAAERERDCRGERIQVLDGRIATLHANLVGERARAEAAESEVATLKARIAELEAGLAALLSVAEGAAEMASERSDWEQVAYRYGDAVLTARRLTHQEKNNGR